MQEVSLAAKHIVKHYGAVVALSDGNLEVQSGEVHALVGANGSGKSTLTKIITGVVAPDEGQLRLDGEAVRFPNPQAAKRRGITAVYQNLSLVPAMTVAQNIWLTHEPVGWGSIVQRDQLEEHTQDLLDLFSGTFSHWLGPDVRVSRLPPDERQIVEILKAYSIRPRLLILDEATARLDSRQVNRLFELVEAWKEQDMAIVFVSHRMEEIFRISDLTTVLRNGKSVGTVPLDGQVSEDDLVAMMVKASALTAGSQVEELALGPVQLRVEELRTNVLRGVSFEVRQGEILGIGGLQGQGQGDLLRALFGDISHRGTIWLEGETVHFRHPGQAMKNGLALVPGERDAEGLLPIRPILENLQLPSWVRYGTILDVEQARQDANRIVDDLNLVMEALSAPVDSLSGGNAQKVVIGKWLLRDPKILLLNDPTKGVDVGTKRELYNLLNQLRQAGTTILFYSSEDEELIGLCDRVIVLYEGKIRRELAGDELNEENLISASIGSYNENKAEPYEP